MLKKIPGPKIIPPKNPIPNFEALKISRKESEFVCTLIAEQRGRDMRALSRVFRLF